MKATHTPAPWKLASESHNDHEAFVIEAEGRTICWTASSLDEESWNETITEEDKANANLIAAAPELLAALEYLLEDHKRMFPEAHPNSTIKWEKCMEVKQALAAIAKAEGKSNPEEDAALATLNKAADQIYNLEGDQWQEAYEVIEAVINKLTNQQERK